MQESSTNERRWTNGSYAAAGFALFILRYNLIFSISSVSLPTYGWYITASAIDASKPTVIFSTPFLDTPSPLGAGNRLIRVNGQTLKEIQDAGHQRRP